MVDYEIYKFTGSYFSFEGEKCQNMPFLGKKPRIGKYRYPWTEIKWYRYQKLVVPIPTYRKGLVPVLVKVVLVPMLLATLIVVLLHCYIQIRTSKV